MARSCKGVHRCGFFSNRYRNRCRRYSKRKAAKGAHDIAGAIGWSALNRPFESKYSSYGCFEYFASGEGIARVARDFLQKQQDYKGELINKESEKITSHDVFAAYRNNDEVAVQVIQLCIEFWGMAVENLINLLDPEKIVFGGGVFRSGFNNGFYYPRLDDSYHCC